METIETSSRDSWENEAGTIAKVISRAVNKTEMVDMNIYVGLFIK
jgi:hypothetical protein